MERFNEGCAMDLRIGTIIAAVYLQGVMDAADALEPAARAEEKNDAI